MGGVMKRIVHFFSQDIGRTGVKIAGITAAAVIGLIGVLWLAAPLLPPSPEEQALRVTILSTVDQECQGVSALDWVTCRSSIISFYAEPVCGDLNEAWTGGYEAYQRYDDCYQGFLNRYDLRLEVG